ncbi:MAG: nitroreductase family protein [Elusimicrobiales bacterium]|jgi:nitroreductase|nr:nitroreductase family protein [Elusimicrobiales bacterium]NLH39633.1 hypothetical protein [Elusimicrobiota bacterium]
MIKEIVKKRRSIRKFKSDDVPLEKIKQIIECARLAPSARNAQPYRFVVMSGDFKNRFADSVFSGVYSPCSFVKKAPVIIAIVKLKPTVVMKIGNAVSHNDYSLIDIGIAGEHIVIAATELGLGSLWVGWFNRDKANEVLKLKKDENVQILIAIGEKDEDPEERKRKSFEDICEFKS